jgi:tetratricopeptide (TPR) repeat protein
MPDHRESREKLAAVLAQVGRPAEAAAELAALGERLASTDAVAAATLAARALALDPAAAAGATPPPEETPDDLRAELEQIDFFVEQELRDEAATALHELARRYRGHPLVAAKARQLELTLVEDLPPEPGAVPREGGPASHAEAAPDPAVPVAVVAGGEQADPSTHGDLGIAYKEMGLYDAAIAEFKLLEADEAKKVFALTMIGECLEAQGAFPEAVVRYKEALNAGAVADAESTQLYYLLGGAFERMGDRQEALYFFEKVAKRSASFRDVVQRIEALKPQAGAPAGRSP